MNKRLSFPVSWPLFQKFAATYIKDSLQVSETTLLSDNKSTAYHI